MKVWDVTPATNFMQVFVAKNNHALIGLSIRRKKIEVKQLPERKILGEWYDADSEELYERAEFLRDAMREDGEVV